MKCGVFDSVSQISIEVAQVVKMQYIGETMVMAAFSEVVQKRATMHFQMKVHFILNFI